MSMRGIRGRLNQIKGSIRIWTKAENHDLLFVTLLAFARSDESAENGGNYKTLFCALNNNVRRSAR